MMTNVSEEPVASIFRVSAFQSGHDVVSTRTFKLYDVNVNFPHFSLNIRNILIYVRSAQNITRVSNFSTHFFRSMFYAQLFAPVLADVHVKLPFFSACNQNSNISTKLTL
jgi:hypothetical protein